MRRAGASLGATLSAGIAVACLVPSYEVGLVDAAGGTVFAGGASGSGGGSSGGNGGGGSSGRSNGGSSSGSKGIGGGGFGGVPPMGGTAGAAGGGFGGAPPISGAGGMPGGNGGSGGGVVVNGICPMGPFSMPALEGNPLRTMSVPPADSFNSMNTGFGIIEGPVWFGSALYMSELSSQPYSASQPNVVRARLLRYDEASDQATVFVGDTGSNGLAILDLEHLVAATHRDGALTTIEVDLQSQSQLVGTYMGAPFNSPNDVAVRSDGNIYFTDPSWQAPNPLPQPVMGLYRVSPNQEVTREATLNQPNGVTLSLDENTLYVSHSGGVDAFPVMAGDLGNPTQFVGIGGDGMTIDCGGNLYVTGDPTNPGSIRIYRPDGMLHHTFGTSAQATTNVAFGGSDRRTLYITGLGTGTNKGLWSVRMNIPGMPY